MIVGCGPKVQQQWWCAGVWAKRSSARVYRLNVVNFVYYIYKLVLHTWQIVSSHTVTPALVAHPLPSGCDGKGAAERRSASKGKLVLVLILIRILILILILLLLLLLIRILMLILVLVLILVLILNTYTQYLRAPFHSRKFRSHVGVLSEVLGSSRVELGDNSNKNNF